MRNCLSLFILLMIAFNVSAEEAVPSYQVGDRLAPITLEDQHEKAHTLDEQTQLLLFTTGMKGGGVIREVLDEEQADFLASRNAMFISNISGMPGLIASMIALPRMRSHEYPIVLDREGEATRRIPAESDKATIIRLRGLQIESISYAQEPEDVRAAITELPAAD